MTTMRAEVEGRVGILEETLEFLGKRVDDSIRCCA